MHKTRPQLTMIGSSIFEQWGQPEWHGLGINNQAISGTTTDFWLTNIATYIQTNTSHLAFYCGGNDIDAGVAQHTIIRQTLGCFEVARSLNTDIKIAYFTLIKAPQKTAKYETINAINSGVGSALAAADLLVDINTVLDQNPQWYIEDGLHLQPTAYQKMDLALATIMQQWVGKFN